MLQACMIHFIAHAMHDKHGLRDLLGHLIHQSGKSDFFWKGPTQSFVEGRLVLIDLAPEGE
ncbi:hypothetical protein XH93_11430 [Bradyrhizobium sp. CCBAU 51753]|nr:hypothetical protein XH93_11430 [Bradyrhizobium sp. CCBAU 51753]